MNKVKIQGHVLTAAAIMLLFSVTALAIGTPVYVYNISATGITSTSATINWSTLLASSSQVAYGTTISYGSLSTLDPTLAVAHSQTITGLTPNTSYHYQVMSRTSTGTLYVAGDFTFLTPPSVVPGMITSVGVTAITDSSATILWTTDRPASSQVQFGTTANSNTYTGVDPALVTSHSVIIQPLLPNTLYHFTAWSVDAAGNYGLSGDNTFTTLPSNGAATLSGVSVYFVTSTSATIAWSTSSAASSQVDYGVTTSYGNSTTLDPAMVTSHLATITQLSPSTIYHYRVRSIDSTGSQLVSPDFTVTTPAFSLFLPQIGLLPNENTGIAITNLDQINSALSLTAFAGAGAQLSGPSVTNPGTLNLNAASQSALLIDQFFSSAPISWPLGWTAINSPTPKLDGFFLTFDTGLSFMDGASLATSFLDSFILPESITQNFTNLVLVNPTSSVSNISIDLVGADGSVRSTFQSSIPGLATFSGDLAQTVFRNIVIAPSDYLRVSSSVALLPHEFFGNPSKDIAILAGQAVSGGATTLYAPQYAIGGPYNSSLSIINLDSFPGNVSLKLIGGDGSQMAPTQIVPIAANGKIYISNPTFFMNPLPSQLTAGYIIVTSDGIRLSGDEVFSDALRGAFLMALPLVTNLQPAVVLSHIASNSTYFTGLAILNPNSVNATVTIQVYTSTGQLDKTVSMVLPPGNRVARLLTEFFPDLLGQNRLSGYIKVIADQGIACYGIFGTNNLSVLSAIPAQPVP